MNKDLLNKIEHEIARCRKCGSCQAACPVYSETLDEAGSPRGKIALAEAMLSGRLKPTRTLHDRISTCLSCSACTSACVNGVKTVEILNFTKNRLFFKRRLLALPNQAVASILKSSTLTTIALRLLRGLITLYNTTPVRMRRLLKLREKRYFPDPQVSVQGKRFTGTYSNDTPFRSSVILFPGCLAELTDGDGVLEIIALLNRLGVSVSIPPGLVCCGAPSYYKGDYDTTIELMKKNGAIFSGDDSRPTCIVTACATCGHILKNIYPQLSSTEKFPPPKLPVMDIQEFLISLPGFTKTLSSSEEPLPDKKIRVTYHDPCHLKRGQNIGSEPRDILKAMPEVEFIEMEDADRCCGGGGTFCFSHPSISKGVAKHKADAIKDSGARIVTTACPACRLQLADTVKESAVEVMHTTQLVERVLEEREKKNT